MLRLIGSSDSSVPLLPDPRASTSGALVVARDAEIPAADRAPLQTGISRSIRARLGRHECPECAAAAARERPLLPPRPVALLPRDFQFTVTVLRPFLLDVQFALRRYQRQLAREAALQGELRECEEQKKLSEKEEYYLQQSIMNFRSKGGEAGLPYAAAFVDKCALEYIAAMYFSDYCNLLLRTMEGKEMHHPDRFWQRFKICLLAETFLGYC